MEKDSFLLDVSAEGELVDLFFLLESLSSFLASLFPLGHLESMSRVLAEDWSIAFASALTAFSTASSQESSSLPWASNWTRMEGLRPFQKYWIMISLFGAAAESNSLGTACKCFRWAIQSRTSSSWYWESFLIFPQ